MNSKRRSLTQWPLGKIGFGSDTCLDRKAWRRVAICVILISVRRERSSPTVDDDDRSEGVTRCPAGEAPVGIEPTNRGFAVLQERLRYTLSRCVPLHQSQCSSRNALPLSKVLTAVVPHLCPNERTSSRWVRRCRLSVERSHPDAAKAPHGAAKTP